jgi:hypothetical protein
MASRCGSQTLVEGTPLGFFRAEPLNSTPNPNDHVRPVGRLLK